jgi:sugar phosphate isomerase/epimerase
VKRDREDVNRREFVGKITVAAAAFGLGGCASGPESGSEAVESMSQSEKDLPIGLQLYTVRDAAEKDFKGTLERVRKIGYRHFEFAGYGGLAAADLAVFLKQIDADAIGTHVGFESSEQDPVAMLSYCREIGVPYVVAPSMPEDLRSGTREQIVQFAHELSDLGQKVKDSGMQLCYHNHSFEFENKVDGETIYDVIFSTADPDLVKAEVDIAWVHHAKVDPVELLDKWGDRIRLLHMKDWDGDGNLAPVGTGVIDWPSVVAKAKQINVDWYIVEQDQPRPDKDIFDEITLSHRNMVQLLS